MDTSFLLGWLAGTLLPLGAIWLLFRLVLRHERCFGYNRALLLLAPVVAVVLPLLPRPAVGNWLAPAASGAVGPVVALPAVVPAAGPAVGWQPGATLLSLYLLGVATMLAALAYRYARLRHATRHLPREHRLGYVLAYTGGRLPTSSFGHTIFWDDTAALTPAEATAVLAHELVHVEQGHSRDVLWLELWRALLWFNPFAHLLLPALRLTHELLADWEAMLLVAGPTDAVAPAAPYPSLLARLAVRRVAGAGYSSLVQSFAFSFTLTRITMLQNQVPVRRWKQWLALPVLGGIFLATACQTNTTEAVRPTLSKEDRKAAFIANVKEALRQDSLHHGGKGWKDETSTLHVSKDGTVTITHQDSGLTLPTLAPKSTGAAPATKVYTFVEQMPALPSGGGMGGIVKQILDNLSYPTGPHQEGRVFVSFTVLADGSVGDTKVIKSLAPAYDEAVVAAIRKLPRFVPGQQGGQPVAVSFTVPVMFKEKP